MRLHYFGRFPESIQRRIKLQDVEDILVGLERELQRTIGMRELRSCRGKLPDRPLSALLEDDRSAVRTPMSGDITPYARRKPLAEKPTHAAVCVPPAQLCRRSDVAGGHRSPAIRTEPLVARLARC